MQFDLGHIQTTYLIKKNLFQLQNRNVSKKNSNLTRPELAMMTNRIPNGSIDIAVGVIIIKKR